MIPDLDPNMSKCTCIPGVNIIWAQKQEGPHDLWISRGLYGLPFFKGCHGVFIFITSSYKIIQWKTLPARWSSDIQPDAKLSWYRIHLKYRRSWFNSQLCSFSVQIYLDTIKNREARKYTLEGCTHIPRVQFCSPRNMGWLPILNIDPQK